MTQLAGATTYGTEQGYSSSQIRTYLAPWNTELAACQAWVVRATQTKRDAKAYYDRQFQRLATAEATMRARANK